jgi:hypothetical protein
VAGRLISARLSRYAQLGATSLIRLSKHARALSTRSDAAQSLTASSPHSSTWSVVSFPALHAAQELTRTTHAAKTVVRLIICMSPCGIAQENRGHLDGFFASAQWCLSTKSGQCKKPHRRQSTSVRRRPRLSTSEPGAADRSRAAEADRRLREISRLFRRFGVLSRDRLAQRTGLPEEELTKQLSHVLAGVVDNLTPSGRLPTLAELSQMK